MPIDTAKAIKIAQEIVNGAALETLAPRAGSSEELIAATALARDLISAATRPQPIATAPKLAMDAELELKPTHWIGRARRAS